MSVASEAATSLIGTKLFVRSMNLTIGYVDDPHAPIDVKFNADNTKGLDVSAMDVEFMVEKSLKPAEPNTCTIRLHNLNETHRQALSGDHSLTVRLEAGYVE